MGDRIVEAYIGEYASGKSEVAVNRAIDLLHEGHPEISLVDLDIVEPCYTLRPIKKNLQGMGLNVLAWDTADTIGLGETGNILRAENKWALKREGDIILDIGYGVEGAKTLNLLEGAEEDDNLQLFVVLNIARPMTSSVNDIVNYVRELKKVDGLINNTHLGDDTYIDIIQDGARIVSEAAEHLGIPVVATTVVKELAQSIGPYDCCGNVVRSVTRYMPESFW
ncbi:MAG: hypothetical protein K9L17_02405 [Clostridiales bacterium]|nr:hypothetical protein [Clostridiales bacterium]MCF8021530.1 hypothetical protein [Clostridiales bacterium]